MYKYLLLQFKRTAKTLPYVGLTALVLFVGLMIILNGVVTMFIDEEDQARVPIAIVGQAEDSYLEMGIAALQSIDSSRYAIEVIQMDEETARRSLERGEIAAYVVIPEGFTEAALNGEVLTLEYVSTVGARSLVSIFKDEITHVIADVVLACQRGMYGIEGAFQALDISGSGKYINKLSISYVELVMDRSQTYQVKELGIRNKLGLEGYLFSGICVVFFALTVLPFGQLLIKRDLSLNKLLAARKIRISTQLYAEYGSFALGYCLILLSAFGFAVVSMPYFSVDLQWLFGQARFLGFVNILATLVLVSSFSFMIFGFATNLVSGMLLQFFVAAAMCFAGGCMYPITFFPDNLQTLAQFLPHSVARVCVSDYLTGSMSISHLGAAFGYSALFLGFSRLTRWLRVFKARG